MINSRLNSEDNRNTEKQQQQQDQLFPEQPKKVKTEYSVEQLGSFQDFLNSQALFQYDVEGVIDLFPNPLNRVVKIKTIEDRRLEREMAKEMSQNGDTTRHVEQIPSTDPPHLNPDETNLEPSQDIEKENVPTHLRATHLNLNGNDIIKPSKNIISEKTKFCESLKPENVDEHMTPGEISKTEIVHKAKPAGKSSPNLLQKRLKEEMSYNKQAQQSTKKLNTDLKVKMPVANPTDTVEPHQLLEKEVTQGNIKPQASKTPNYEMKRTHCVESTKVSTLINKNMSDIRTENTLPKIMSFSTSTLQIVRNEATQITTHFKCKK